MFIYDEPSTEYIKGIHINMLPFLTIFARDVRFSFLFFRFREVHQSFCAISNVCLSIFCALNHAVFISLSPKFSMTHLFPFDNIVLISCVMMPPNLGYV